MEDFSVITYTTPIEYARLMIVGLYKRPAFIITSFGGLFLMITAILNYLKITDYNTYGPISDFVLGLLILLAPCFIALMAIRQFKSNPNFQNDIKYTFGEDKMIVEGTTFKGEFQWVHIIKQKEIGKFLILYHNKRMGNFIDKTKLTTEQLAFIKSKVRQQ